MIVFLNASIIPALLNNLVYQSVVKPPHFARDFDALNESTISTAIGAYKNMTTSATYSFIKNLFAIIPPKCL
jgi:hypothetical protein